MSKIEKRRFKAKEIIFREGDEALCMYDVRLGSVGIYAHYGTTKEKLLSRIVPDQFFGEMGMIDGEPRSATAVALEGNTELEVITPEVFGEYIREKPGKVVMMMEHMSRRLRSLTQEYDGACRTLTRLSDARQKGEAIDEELSGKRDVLLRALSEEEDG